MKCRSQEDECWERRSHQLQQRREALLLTLSLASVSSPLAAGGNVSCAEMAQITKKESHWYLGQQDIFGFTDEQASRGAGAIYMQIIKGCTGCKFSFGQGVLDSANRRMTVVASGKGENYTHIAQITTDEQGKCRLHWGDNWADFCQGGACVGPSPPSPPRPPLKGAACEKMLTAGFWQPWS
eukprot:SAG11_NODE_8057_length_1064_cov_1.223834_2_plen_182_part_00